LGRLRDLPVIYCVAEKSFAFGSRLFVLFRVTSWIVLISVDKRQSTNQHETTRSKAHANTINGTVAEILILQKIAPLS